MIKIRLSFFVLWHRKNENRLQTQAAGFVHTSKLED